MGAASMKNVDLVIIGGGPAGLAAAVAARKDYSDGTMTDCATGKQKKMELSGSNVLRFELADGTSIIVRPSGTEPKIKVYILTHGADKAQSEANVKKYGAWAEALKK